MAQRNEQLPPERAYPNVEIFLETRERADVESAFSATREALAGLPKIKAEQGKRALLALEKTEALLNQLFDVKDTLAAQATSSKKARR